MCDQLVFDKGAKIVSSTDGSWITEKLEPLYMQVGCKMVQPHGKQFGILQKLKHELP